MVAATCEGLTGLAMGLSMFRVDGLALSLVPVVEVDVSVGVWGGDPGAGGGSG